jgi:hypothetical protein
MTNKFYLTLLFSIVIHATIYAQEKTIVNNGIHLRIIDLYSNMSNSINVYENNYILLTANTQGGMGIGTSFGYRSHGKLDIDYSVDLSYIFSSHRVEYPASVLKNLLPNNQSLQDQSEINQFNLNTLSLDLSIYFYTASRFQPFVTVGGEIYLNNVHLRSATFYYFTDPSFPLGPIDTIKYTFDKIYSGFGMHLGIGGTFYIISNISINGFVRLSGHLFSIKDTPFYKDDVFNFFNIEYGTSLSVLL